jgi:hypothetical protein
MRGDGLGKNSMTYAEEIATLGQRIRKAETDRDAWKAAGLQERYLEAYFLAESLETEMLQRMRRERTEHAPD